MPLGSDKFNNILLNLKLKENIHKHDSKVKKGKSEATENVFLKTGNITAPHKNSKRKTEIDILPIKWQTN